MKNTFKSIKRQFLSGTSLKELDGKLDGVIENIDWDTQEELMRETVLHILNTKFPLRTDYQIAFLKFVIKELERHNIEEIHDVIYEQLALKLKEDKPDFSFKHFLLADNEDAISIKESNSFIRDGTTGLKLWPAAMALGEFILQNTETFNGKSILELGSGATGFVGMVLVKYSSPKKVFLSDCHDSVIESLIQNVSWNLDSCARDSMDKSLLIRERIKVKDGAEVAILNLPWEDIEKHKDELRLSCKPEVVIAADVIYDDTIFNALIKCIINVFDVSGPSTIFYLSQTVRNIETYEKFCYMLIEHNFEIFQEKLSQERTFNWEEPADIRFLRVSSKRNIQKISIKS